MFTWQDLETIYFWPGFRCCCVSWPTLDQFIWATSCILFLKIFVWSVSQPTLLTLCCWLWTSFAYQNWNNSAWKLVGQFSKQEASTKPRREFRLLKTQSCWILKSQKGCVKQIGYGLVMGLSWEMCYFWFSLFRCSLSFLSCDVIWFRLQSYNIIYLKCTFNSFNCYNYSLLFTWLISDLNSDRSGTEWDVNYMVRKKVLEIS